jgi:hypothetical protein
MTRMRLLTSPRMWPKTFQRRTADKQMHSLRLGLKSMCQPDKEYNLPTTLKGRMFRQGKERTWCPKGVTRCRRHKLHMLC